MNALHRLTVTWLVTTAATCAHAGQACEARPPQTNDVVRGMTLAANTAPLITDSLDPFEINLERGTAGSARIGFKIRNVTELLQSDEGSFQIKL